MHTLQMANRPTEAIAYAINTLNTSEVIEVPDFREGYEYTINAMPDFTHPDTPPTPGLIDYAASLMRGLATDLGWGGWVHDKTKRIAEGQKDRTILGIDRNGPEIVVGTWGKGFADPVHGHGPGFLNDILLTGKLLSNTYRFVGDDRRTVRTVQTKILHPMDTMLRAQHHTRGNHKRIGGDFYPPDRTHGVHNFIPLENSSSLHFLPEHPRDGYDNTFEVEHFENVYRLGAGDFSKMLKSDDELRGLNIGDVVLSRDRYGTDLGDHYIVITGAPILATWGVRKLTGFTIQAPHASFLNFFQDLHRVDLQLNPVATKRFYEFHNIFFADGKINLSYED